MTQDSFMHGLGIASLFVFMGTGALALGTIITSLHSRWPRIAAALRGEITFPTAHPQPLRPRTHRTVRGVRATTKTRDAA